MILKKNAITREKLFELIFKIQYFELKMKQHACFTFFFTMRSSRWHVDLPAYAIRGYTRHTHAQLPVTCPISAICSELLWLIELLNSFSYSKPLQSACCNFYIYKIANLSGRPSMCSCCVKLLKLCSIYVRILP